MSKKIATLLLLFFTISVARGQEPQSETAQSLFEKGVRLLRERSYEQALSTFEASARLNSKQPATYANIGTLYIILRRYDKAESAFRTAIQLAPKNGEFYAELCRALSLQKKHTEALSACEQGVRLSPASDRTEAARLSALLAAGHNVAELQRLADIAVGRFRQSEILLLIAVDIYLYNRNFVYAAELLESLVRMRPDVSKFHGLLAETYLRLGRDTDALASARTALRLEPLNPYANYAMGLIFFELGQHDEAVDSFGKINTDDQRLNYAAYYQAVSESRRGRKEVAVSLLRNLARQYPDNVEFVYQLALNLGELDRFEEAIPLYQRANELQPKNLDFMLGLAVSNMMRANFESSIALFEELTRIKPDNEHYRMFLGVARSRQTIAPRLPAMMREAEGDPKNITIRFELVRMLAFTNRITEADKYIKELYELNPESHDVYVGLAIAFSEAGRNEQALDAYKKSLAKKETPSAYLGLASIYRNRGEFDLAAASFAKVIELKPDTPNIMRAYADLLRENGKRREALEMYKRSLGLLPSNAQALFHAGLLSLKLGDKSSATQYLAILRTVDAELAKTLSRCIALRIWSE